mgnify:CR=1 FL=1
MSCPRCGALDGWGNFYTCRDVRCSALTGKRLGQPVAVWARMGGYGWRAAIILEAKDQHALLRFVDPRTNQPKPGATRTTGRRPYSLLVVRSFSQRGLDKPPARGAPEHER